MGQLKENREARLEASRNNAKAFEDYRNNIDKAYENARNYYSSRNLNANAMDFANKIGSAAANQVQTAARSQGLSQGQALAQARESAAQNAINAYGNAYNVAMNQANQLANTEQNKMRNLEASNTNAKNNFEVQRKNERAWIEDTKDLMDIAGKGLDASGNLVSGLSGIGKFWR